MCPCDCICVCVSPFKHVYLHILDTYCKNMMLFEVSLCLCNVLQSCVDCKLILGGCEWFNRKKKKCCFVSTDATLMPVDGVDVKHVCFCVCMFFCPSLWRPLPGLQIEKELVGRSALAPVNPWYVIISHPYIFPSMWESRIQSRGRVQQILLVAVGRLRGWRDVQGGQITI